jgi:hypothetical protein
MESQMKSNLLPAILTLISLPCAAAGGEALDVKLGLWETTSTVEMTGLPPIPPQALANMPPEQRAQMEAMMKSVGAQGPRTVTDKSCVTKESLQDAFKVEEKGDASCKRTIVNQTRTQQDVHIECPGEGQRSGDFHLTAVNNENITGNMQMAGSGGGNTMNMNMQMSGKWLGADCGKVK